MDFFALVNNNTPHSASQSARVITYLLNLSNSTMLPKGEPNKVIRAHKVEWVEDKTLKEGTKALIKTLNKWDSTANHSLSKWVHTSNQVFTVKCTVVRFQECRHPHRM